MERNILEPCMILDGTGKGGRRRSKMRWGDDEKGQEWKKLAQSKNEHIKV